MTRHLWLSASSFVTSFTVEDESNNEQTFPHAADPDPIYSKVPEEGVEYPEVIAGVPVTWINKYADIAVRHARVTKIDNGVWYADVVGLDGAWGDGDTPEAARASLKEGIVGWAAVKLKVGAPVPPIDGLDINLHSG